ncbi:MAG TPA: ABC transporter substrate-binding protein, partial [Lacipirellula sp.]
MPRFRIPAVGPLLLMLIALTTRPALSQQEDDAEAPDAAAQTSAQLPGEESVEIAERLLDREPFDRITLDADNDNMVIETVLLDLPDRQVPNPLPEEGKLVLRRLSEPSIPYELDWAAVEKIELYEQILLAEAQRLTAAGEFAEAFDYFAFLTTNYPKLPGLEAALQSHLWSEASAAYAAGRREVAWPVLHALYLRNPQFPRLVAAVQAVMDDMIAARFDQQDYAGARSVLTTAVQTFPKLQLENVARWNARFEADAVAQLDKARTAFEAERYSQARAAISRATAILPTVPGGEELWKQIQGSAPEFRVGVSQFAEGTDLSKTLTWSAARVAGLVNPRLVEMVDFGAEGGVYASRWCNVATSDDGLETTIRVSPVAARQGLRPDRIALELAHVGMEGVARGFGDFAALVQSVRTAAGQDVVVRWRHLHVRPESLLQVPLRTIVTADEAPGLWFQSVIGEAAPKERPFERTGPPESGGGQPRFVVELQYSNDEAALAALARGDVDVIDRVPPWQLARLEQSPEIVVAAYRLPTIHVLIPNAENELLQTREFRRALCYGIDGESIVRDILLAGESRQGFRTISGPFLAGASLSDPVGYAYDADLQSRPYEPRLAAMLAGIARQMVAKREAAAKKQQAAEAEAEKSDAQQPANADMNEDAGDETDSDAPPPTTPLILAHSTDPLARLACQTIKAQLDAIGIPVKLAEFAGGAPA